MTIFSQLSDIEFFPGLSEMENIHPLLVHFPIAFLSAFVVIEFLGLVFRKQELRMVASWMLYLGTLGAMAAVAAGLWASETVSHGGGEIHSMMDKHRNYGLNVLALAIVLSVWRLLTGGRFSLIGRIFHFILALVMVGNMALGADLGGLMVYKHGVAVRAAPPLEETNHHKHGGIKGQLLEWFRSLIRHEEEVRPHHHG